MEVVAPLVAAEAAVADRRPAVGAAEGVPPGAAEAPVVSRVSVAARPGAG